MTVGIDLGTTHTVVAYADGDTAKLLPIPQLVAPGQRDALPLLPSNLYLPLQSEAGDGWICGELARKRGAEVSQRHVSSAKSWLSYGGVDRRAAILPWQLEAEDNPKLSPVQASTCILEHVASAWNTAFPKRPLAKEEVVLTVPASFDAVARELTAEAARAAGLTVRLLEEPQAAFYDFLRIGGDAALDAVLGDAPEAIVLVCDVGGGTTDLSLMRVRREGLAIDRVAVGKHLLLGGDNMDLALAHLCERRLVAAGERLPPGRFAKLVAACRTAKEQLLAEGAPDGFPIALAGSGAKLVGGALRTELTRDEVQQVVLEGFFPEVAFDERGGPPSRAGMVAFGLPYEREVAITRHLRTFLKRHQAEGLPSAVLFNGGVFRAPSVADRIQRTLTKWRDGEPVRVLTLTDPDTSVALGAVTYGLSLRGRGRRIGGGAAKSYFLGLRGEQAVCVLPRGTEEGDRQRVERGLEVVVNKAVRFDIYASDFASTLGAVTGIGREHERLAPLVTKLDEYGDKKKMPVALEAELSAIGTLELSCVEREVDKARRFALAFDLRVDDDASGHEVSTAASRYGKRLEEARAAVERVYSKRTRKEVEQKEVKGLVRELERIFGKRGRWDASLLRALYDVVWTHHRGRKTTLEHERIFWMLAGFCLRPGLGHARDQERATLLFKLFEQRLAHPELRSWQQFWICWRRVAAALPDKAQVKLRDIVDPFVAPSEQGLKQPKSFRNEAGWEMLELASSLERVPAKRRGALGTWILERTWTERDPRLWAALGRVGARLPTYGSAHHVVAARTVEGWMDHLLREKWESIPSAPRAAVAMCRITGDRARDVSDATRASVAKRLRTLAIDEDRIRPILELVALDDVDRAAFYGEDLPIGLVLAD